MAPRTIGRYQIKKTLGRGGMATVYLAHDPRFKRDVALKVLPREFLHDPTFHARFEREAQTIAALEHPAIVPVYDFGEQEGQPFLVMRYMPGGSLADRLSQGSLSITETDRVLGQLAPALDVAHLKGIVHRDLKPGNILFDQYGDAYLSDFGIAKLVQATTTFTGSGVIGTPAYMSPEQVHGDKELDGRSDIYSMGVILYEMLTGDVPYQADTPVKQMMMHLLDPVPNILESKPNLPTHSEKVITKALAKERDERYPTMAVFVSSISELVVEASPLSEGEEATVIVPADARSIEVPQDTAIEGEVAEEAADPRSVAPLQEEILQEIVSEEAPKPASQQHVISKPRGPKLRSLTKTISPAERLRWVSTRPWIRLGIIIIVVAGGGFILYRSLQPSPRSAAIAPMGTQPSSTPATLTTTSQPVYTSTPRPTPTITPTPLPSPTPKLEVITLENASRLKELMGFEREERASAATWSPDGTLLAAGYPDTVIIIWDVLVSEQKGILSGHTDDITSLGWSWNGKKLASASMDNTIRIWDVESKQELFRVEGHSDNVRSLAWSPYGTMLASGGDDEMVLVWDRLNLELLHELPFGERVIGVTWSPDTTHLAAAGQNGRIRVWETSSWTEVGQRLARKWLTSIAWSTDGELLATGYGDGAYLWKMPGIVDFSVDLVSETMRNVWSLAWSPNGRLLATGGPRYVRIWDVQTGEELELMSSSGGGSSALAWSADGKRIAACIEGRRLGVYGVLTDQ